jgi:predicted AAA+ superfamily ATPase
VHAIERITDALAQKLGMDPADLLPKNFIRPEQFPYKSAFGWECGERAALGRGGRLRQAARSSAGYSGLPLLNVENVDIINVVNVDKANEALLAGNLALPGLFPRLEALDDAPAIFRFEFGLDELPSAPGVILIRGARQYGKSTWLESAIRDTVRRHGPGTALLLDGDYLRDADHLASELSRLALAFRPDAPVRRLFVDEITAVPDWERGLKRVLDRGELRRVLVVTTGSRASDLRHGAERLPGRKGTLGRTTYLFLPIPYAEFHRAGAGALGEDALPAYLLSGGSPLACGELIRNARLAEWTIESVRDWIQGECARSARPRRSLVAVMQQLHLHGGTPLGQTKLAREAGLANNTVAAGWIEMLSDLLCVGTSAAWDGTRRSEIARNPAKFPFVNLLAAAAWAPEAPRSPGDLAGLSPERQGAWQEWAVAQELFRRAALRGAPDPERIPYWRSREHELDFVAGDDWFVEVKRGRASALDFAWFRKTFPKARLTVVCASPFAADHIRGITLDAFLRGEA